MAIGQKTIPIDTTHWEISARAHIIEKYKGKDAIYLQAGGMTLKNQTFLNGTIEYDIYLKKEAAFPGVYFRSTKDGDSEQWYIRPHLPGKADANQATGVFKGITPWQLHFGPKYSFPYEYKYDDWTHVKIVVNNDQAQIYLDHATEPNLSWKLFNPIQEGEISFRGGNASGLHLANISIDKTATRMKDFSPIERKPIEGLVQQWVLSDKFEEKLLDNTSRLKSIIAARKWNKKVQVEEGTAANISRQITLRDDNPGNTVFAKLVVRSDKKQTKRFQFGYSDRVVAIVNGNPVYKGNNRWRSRDYRYLGTIGLFDEIYVDLKKGENTILLAVSEDFGGWLVTGKFEDMNGITIK